MACRCSQSGVSKHRHKYLTVEINFKYNMNKSNDYTRRKLLSVTAGVGLIGLAGCTSKQQSEEQNIPNKNFSINVPEELLTSFELYKSPRQQQSINVDYLNSDITFTVGTDLYEDVAVRNKIEELTLGEFDKNIPFRIVGPTYVDISSNSGILSGAMDLAESQIESQVDSQFSQQLETQLDEFGISNIEKTTDEPLHKEYTGEIVIPPIDISDEIPAEEEVIIEPDPAEIHAGYQLYNISDSLDFIGILWIEPEDTYTHDVKEISVSGSDDDGLNIDPEVTLNFGEYATTPVSEFTDWAKTESQEGNEQI